MPGSSPNITQCLIIGFWVMIRWTGCVESYFVNWMTRFGIYFFCFEQRCFRVLFGKDVNWVGSWEVHTQRNSSLRQHWRSPDSRLVHKTENHSLQKQNWPTPFFRNRKIFTSSFILIASTSQRATSLRLLDVPLQEKKRKRGKSKEALETKLSFISAFSTQGQAAVPLSTAWHSATLLLPARAKAKSTFIFPAGSSVDKQGTSSHAEGIQSQGLQYAQ